MISWNEHNLRAMIQTKIFFAFSPLILRLFFSFYKNEIHFWSTSTVNCIWKKTHLKYFILVVRSMIYHLQFDSLRVKQSVRMTYLLLYGMRCIQCANVKQLQICYKTKKKPNNHKFEICPVLRLNIYFHQYRNRYLIC